MERRGIIWLAAAGTAVTVAFAVAPAVLYENPEFSAHVALLMAEVIAIIWTAAFAAENLRILKEARLDEFRPVMNVLPVYRPSGEPKISLHVRNFGKGTAAELEVVLWWKDKDLVEWLPHHIREVDELLRPGEVSEGEHRAPWVRFRLEKDEAVHLVVELNYRDSRSEFRRERIAFRYSTVDHTSRFVRAGQSALPDLKPGGKEELLKKYAAGLEADFALADKGLSIVPQIDGGAMRLLVKHQDTVAFSAQSGREEAIYEIVNDVTDYLERLIPEAIDGAQQVQDQDT